MGIDYIQKNIDLRAVALTRYHVVNENAFESGEPIVLDIYSKISAVQSDFSIKDIVAESNVELAVCACSKDSVIYCEKGKAWTFKSTSSDNRFTTHSDSILYKCYDDAFVIEEGGDCGNKKVTAFDMNLNIISSSIMPFSDLNEYETEKLNKHSAFNNFTAELREAHPNLSIDFDFNAFNENTSHYLVAACNVHTRKNYIVKFNGNKEAVWQIEMPNITTNNILVFENRFYALYFTDKCGKKWRLTKFTNDGNPLDNYDFNGEDAVLTLHNKKPVIIYKDISKLTPQQRQIVKATGERICPAAMLIVE